MTNNQNLLIKLFNNEAILLALIPILCTFLAFLFELGRLTAFNIPTTFITLDFTTSVKALIFLIPILLYLSIQVTFFNLVNNKHPFRTILIISILFYITLLLGIYILFAPIIYSYSQAWYWIQILYPYLIFMFFVFPCFLLGIPLLFDNENKFKTPKNFVEYWARITSEKISFRVSNIKSLLHTIYVFLIPLLFLMPLIGYFQSIMRADYWVLVEQPEMALIINYDDKFIFKKRDLNTKMFLPYIEILQINESTPLQIRFEYSAINPKLNTKQSEE